jgi:hypothetical protein
MIKSVSVAGVSKFAVGMKILFFREFDVGGALLVDQ